MKISIATKNAIVYFITLLYIVLFVYAGVNKLLDFEKFQLQLAQSPMLTAYADFFSIAVICVEFAISILLLLPRFRRVALLAAFTLMVLFTVYIFIILHYSPYVPCSCGGILEKMGWEEHLFFNLGFVALGALAAYLSETGPQVSNLFVTLHLFALSVGGVVLMGGLFLLAEDTLHHRNNFVRRIPPTAVSKVGTLDLGFNTYYFAGADKGKIYLGNYSAPAVITVLDSTLKRIGDYRITLDDTLNFKSVHVRVRPPFFYVFDGNVPCIYQGSIKNWHAKLLFKDLQRFSVMVPLDSNKVAFRSATLEFGNLLGTIDLESDSIVYKHDLLQKQVDGVFDTDGSLHYSVDSKRFVYVYYYRNQYTVTDYDLSLLHRGNTIDTTTQAKIKVQYLEKTKQTKFAAPPQIVNRQTALCDNLLFVNSMLPGKFEPRVMWNKAAMVDVYDIHKKSYVMSFYVSNMLQKKFSGFVVTGTHLFALFDSTLVAYRLDTMLTKEYDHQKK